MCTHGQKEGSRKLKRRKREHISLFHLIFLFSLSESLRFPNRSITDATVRIHFSHFLVGPVTRPLSNLYILQQIIAKKNWRMNLQLSYDKSRSQIGNAWTEQLGVKLRTRPKKLAKRVFCLTLILSQGRDTVCHKLSLIFCTSEYNLSSLCSSRVWKAENYSLAS